MITVAIIDGSNCCLEASTSNTDKANCIPNMEWIIAKTSGSMKNIAICLNKAWFIIFSSQPIFLKIIYLCLLSELSVSCFNARIAQLAIRKIIPK